MFTRILQLFLTKYDARYDVLIVDTGLEGIDGVKLMRRIRDVDQAVDVIYVAFSDGQVMGGYEVGALSYILKPPTYYQFSHTMTRCLASRKRGSINIVRIMSGGKERRVRADEILYASSYRHRTVLHMMTGNQQVVCSLAKLEERFTNYRHFFRINSGYLVNMAHIDLVENHQACMANGDRLLISRPRRTAFRQVFAHYIDSLSH